jgi:hypothetical protein
MADLGQTSEAAQLLASLQEEGPSRAARDPAEALRAHLASTAS